MSTLDTNNVTVTVTNKPVDQPKTQTELEMEVGSKAVDRYTTQRALTLTPTSANCTINVVPSPLSQPIDGGVTAAVTAKRGDEKCVEREIPPAEPLPVPGVVPQVAVPATATVTTPVANAANGTGLAKNEMDFLQRVLPWPKEREPGFINLHWRTPSPSNPNKMIWLGKPTRTVDEFLNLTKWALSRSTIKDIYFCLSLQSQTGKNSRGNLTAARHQADALSLKAIWLDIDVKDPPKGYATIQEAWAALKNFYTAVGLPRPSALIASGGGLHVYWISKTPLTPDQWRPLAGGLKNVALKHGLRCDAGCTVNSAQILRVPGTWNCKKELRRPVQLLSVGNEYDF